MSTQVPSQLTQNIPPGLSAFDTLRAEEEPWLADCFVPPSDFSLIAGTRSTIIFGEEGSGKTALYRMLLRYLRPTQRQPERLVVEWEPPLFDPAKPLESSTAEMVAEHALSASVAEFSRHIARWPDRVMTAPNDVKSALAWFMRRYAGTANEEPWFDILPQSAPDEFIDRANIPRLISEFTKALKEVGLSGVLILAIPEDVYEGENVWPSLFALASSLNLLDQPQFVYKFVLSAEQESNLREASGVERRRLDLIPLRWLTEELVTIVERRLAMATWGKVTQLSDLCDDAHLANWLTRTGGNTPRGWLLEVRPLIAHYLAQHRPITTREWKSIRRQRPPQFAIDLQSRRVVVGNREVEDIGEIEWALLGYLYQNRNRVCTRNELFKKVYSERTKFGASEKKSDLPQGYEEGILDTALWRLRNAIEPDLRNPIYVVTHRGLGVRLENL